MKLLLIKGPSLRQTLATLTLTAAGLAGAATYRVQPGDNLTVIARRTGVTVAALKTANPGLRNANHVQAGRSISIPARRSSAARPVAARPGTSRMNTGTHRVRRGENLTVIARRYGVTLAALLRANPTLDARRALWAGATVRLPGRNGGGVTTSRPANRTSGATVRTASIRVSPAPGAASAGEWLWPVPGYRGITSDFGPRVLGGERELHLGVDILAPHGTTVRAARSGRVIESRADLERGWGWTVVLEHPDGWITRYAHLSATLARTGELVTAGQPIGRVGNTGRTTGTHLHFGTYLRWDPRDPLTLYSE